MSIKVLTTKEKEQITFFLEELLIGSYISKIKWIESRFYFYLKRDNKKEFMGEKLSSEIFCLPPFSDDIFFLNDNNYKKLTENLISEDLEMYAPNYSQLAYKLTELLLNKVKIISIKLEFYFLEIKFEDSSILHLDTKHNIDDGFILRDKKEKKVYLFGGFDEESTWNFYFGAGGYYLKSPVTKKRVGGYWDDTFKNKDWYKYD